MAERQTERRRQAPDADDDARAVEPADSFPGSDPGDAYHRARRAGEMDDERPPAGEDANPGPGVGDVFRSGS